LRRQILRRISTSRGRRNRHAWIGNCAAATDTWRARLGRQL